MLNNGDSVQVRKNEKSEWMSGFTFVGMTSSNEFLVEQKGAFQRFSHCRKVENKQMVPMSFDDICELISWRVLFRHASGAIVANPTITMISTDDRVIIDGHFVNEMEWAEPENAKLGKWNRCEVEKCL